jgi:hypothetical protein
MKNLTKMISLGIASAVLATSCATMTPAQKTALLGESLSVLGSVNTFGNKTKGARFANDLMTISGTAITNQAYMQHDLEVANAGRDQIVINNGQPNYQNQNYNQSNNLENSNNGTPRGLFVYKKWIDFNNDGIVNKDELLGFNEPSYNVRDLDFLGFSFYAGADRSYDSQDLSFNIYSMEDGRTIKSFNEQYTSYRMPDFKCESFCFPKSGKYKAVLNAGNNRNFSLDFEVVK